mmetsp:Transcript_132407/g.247582  ORF Transcript_132407/g.247582 Transcript_132407/m.247582 type:complete len:224 (-) Transcript_132407:339-1010(-)
MAASAFPASQSTSLRLCESSCWLPASARQGSTASLTRWTWSLASSSSPSSQLMPMLSSSSFSRRQRNALAAGDTSSSAAVSQVPIIIANLDSCSTCSWTSCGGLGVSQYGVVVWVCVSNDWEPLAVSSRAVDGELGVARKLTSSNVCRTCPSSRSCAGQHRASPPPPESPVCMGGRQLVRTPRPLVAFSKVALLVLPSAATFGQTSRPGRMSFLISPCACWQF